MARMTVGRGIRRRPCLLILWRTPPRLPRFLTPAGLAVQLRSPVEGSGRMISVGMTAERSTAPLCEYRMSRRKSRLYRGTHEAHGGDRAHPKSHIKGSQGGELPSNLSERVELSTLFRLRTMDSEVLILIPAASHSAANRSCESWRSRSDEANRTTSSAKCRDPILRSPNRTPSTPWLEIGDKGQPWRPGVQPSLETSLTYYRQCGPSSDTVIQGTDSPYRGPIPCTPREPPTGLPEGTRSNAFYKSTKHMWTGWANSHAPSRILQRV